MANRKTQALLLLQLSVSFIPTSGLYERHTDTDRQTSGVSHIALHSIQMLVQILLTTARQNITSRDREQTVAVSVTVHISSRHAVAVDGQISITLSILSLYHSSEPNLSTCSSKQSVGPKQSTLRDVKIERHP